MKIVFPAAAAAARFISRKAGAGLHGRRMMSSTSMTNPSSPWLMLPPTLDKTRGGMVYNFYSLADDEVVLINKYGGGADPTELPDDNARVVGSSHGWLALMNRRNNELFLSNPITRRHIKLPPIESLPEPEMNLRRGKGRVSKVILSSSPDAADCRAMMSFGPGGRLAFCRPGHSEEWAPIGQLFMEREDPTFKYARVYDDFVFSSKSNLFTCLTVSYIHDLALEDWDLRMLDSPKIGWIQRQADETEHVSLVGERSGRISVREHLAYAEQTDEVFLLSRSFDGGRTIGFIVSRVQKEEGGIMRLVPCSSLGGLALFVGTNHSFALSAPHLKPNSIYFTDNKYYYTPPRDHRSRNYEGGDVGIFHCGDRTFSNCYYPFHNTTLNNTRSIAPAPIWFTPTLI